MRARDPITLPSIACVLGAAWVLTALLAPACKRGGAPTTSQNLPDSSAAQRPTPTPTPTPTPYWRESFSEYAIDGVVLYRERGFGQDCVSSPVIGVEPSGRVVRGSELFLRAGGTTLTDRAARARDIVISEMGEVLLEPRPSHPGYARVRPPRVEAGVLIFSIPHCMLDGAVEVRIDLATGAQVQPPPADH